MDEVGAPCVSGLLGACAGVGFRAECAGEDLGEKAIGGERGLVGWPGRGLVEVARPAWAGAPVACCLDEACFGEEAEVCAGGVQVQSDAGCEFARVEWRLCLLQDLEDPLAAWFGECAMERRLLVGDCRARRCHGRVLSASSLGT